MSSCPGCGAPVDSGRLICSFCGLVTQELASVADELKALDELSRIALKMAQEGSGGGVFGAMRSNMAENLGGGQSTRIARFWQNAFIPRTLEAQSQAMLHVFSQVVPPEDSFGAMQYAMNSAKQKNSAIFLDRGEAILTAMRVQHAGDSTAAAKIAVLKGELEKERQLTRAARTKGWMVYAAMMIGMLAILGGMALLVTLLPGPVRHR